MILVLGEPSAWEKTALPIMDELNDACRTLIGPVDLMVAHANTTSSVASATPTERPTMLAAPNKVILASWRTDKKKLIKINR